MSGIYIQGMEMPTDVTLLAISPDGTVDIISGQPDLSWKTLKDKAAPVSPHGRLIDADALIKELTLDDEDDNSGASLLMAIFLEVLKAAPTIIPADKEEQL